MSSFLKKIDRKRFIFVGKIIFIFVSIVMIVNLVGETYTRYESKVDLSANASTAFFVVDQGTYESSISLTGLVPSLEPLYYKFYVANYDKDGNKTNVDLNYTIKFETTTNLPLTYEIVRNEDFSGSYTNIIQNSSVRQDENDVFYNVFTNNNKYSFGHKQKELDEYTLKVIFPESYKDYPDLYQGVIELFSIIIDATQVA
jgi:hypothetical protein